MPTLLSPSQLSKVGNAHPTLPKSIFLNFEPFDRGACQNPRTDN